MNKLLCWLGLHARYLWTTRTGGIEHMLYGCNRCSKVWYIQNHPVAK